MTVVELLQTAESLEKKISVASLDQKLRLQPEFSRVVERLAHEGESIPLRMRKLEAALVDEVIEARFDNMPI